MNMIAAELAGTGRTTITAPLPAKITGGRLSELLERIPYISESVKSVKYLEFEHSAYIELSVNDPIEVDAINNDLQELIAALLVSKIAAQKTLKTQVRPVDGQAHVYADHSVAYYDGDDVKLIEAIDGLLQHVATRHGAQIREYASIYSSETMGRNGYHKNFPQNVYGVTQIPHNYTLIKEIRESASSDIPPQLFQSHGAFLQPCVCYHCYAEVQQSTQSELIYTLKGRCFRHEIQWRLNSFRRNEFTMREIVFMGTPDYVESKRITIMNEVWGLFCDLGLYGQIVTARDPFFHYDDMKTKGAVQLMADAKYELEFVSATGASSSIASFNNCQDTLCEKFAITDQQGVPLHSGCVAFGIDRWRAALFEQYGSNSLNWPQLLKNSK